MWSVQSRRHSGYLDSSVMKPSSVLFYIIELIYQNVEYKFI